MSKPPETVSAGLGALLIRAREVVRAGSVLVVIRDGANPDEGIQAPLQALVKYTDVVVCDLVDPIDMRAPVAGQYTFCQGAVRMQVDTLDPIRCEQYEQDFLRREFAWQGFCQRHRITPIRIMTNEDPLFALAQGFYQRHHLIRQGKYRG